MAQQFELTKEGIAQLEDELNNLINVSRPEIVKAITAAREQGDLSENADYDAAKNKQAEIESRISEIQNILQHAHVIKSVSSKSISIGSYVTYVNESTKKEATYQIVGEFETNPLENKISNVSPLALAILGKAEGDVVNINGINKPYKIKIVKVK